MLRKIINLTGVLLVLSLIVIACSNAESTKQISETKENSTSTSEGFPVRPITVLVPWGTGGGSDQMNRAPTSYKEQNS